MQQPCQPIRAPGLTLVLSEISARTTFISSSSADQEKKKKEAMLINHAGFQKHSGAPGDEAVLGQKTILHPHADSPICLIT